MLVGLLRLGVPALCGVVGLMQGMLSAATLHVWQGSPQPAPPYASWAQAAHTIQEAVDAAQAGDLVLVTNGVYATGGRPANDGVALTSRVAIDRPITVQSAAGPGVTTILGAAGPGGSNGVGAVRCVYLGSDAVLSGFSLVGGHTLADYWVEEGSGGGVYAELFSVVTNCIISDNSAASPGGGVFGGTLLGCVLVGNSTDLDGGGASQATLDGCVLFGNSAGEMGGGASSSRLSDCTLNANVGLYGGGAESSVLNHCTLSGNSASQFGGGAYSCELAECALDHNSAEDGGGAASGQMDNCTLTWNTAVQDGGGAWLGSLRNSVVTGNSAARNGGGAYGAGLHNCTVTGNTARDLGGGVSQASAYNCILYYNTGRYGSNHWLSPVYYSCTTPLPQNGEGNIAAEPQLASDSHLSPTSPCIGAGSAQLAQGVDVDGEPWADPPCIGADQFVIGGEGPLGVAIDTDYTEVSAGFGVALRARIEGQPTWSRWDLGDGTMLTNQPYILAHAWASPGQYDVQLIAYNETHPEGVSATLTMQVWEQPVFYVNSGNLRPQYPYDSWGSAARTVQEAIRTSQLPGRLVLVTNGVYGADGEPAPGSALSNRVVLTGGVEVRSVNGPAATVLLGQAASGGGHGDDAVRCAYVGTDCILSGFTLTNGHTRTVGATGLERSGGGAFCERGAVLTNCWLVGNQAARDGGGADGATLLDCLIQGNVAGDDSGGADECTLVGCQVLNNSASDNAGGADQSTLYRCTLSGNSAQTGGGVDDSILFNCTLLDNVASQDGGGATDSEFHNCVISGNKAGRRGGGAMNGSFYNCTITGNSADQTAGGTHQGVLYNSIVYYNTAPSSSNYVGSGFYYCCTTPSPSSGEGNIEADPQLASVSHLSLASPCRGTGSPFYASGVDIDGEAWLNPPDMGADQLVPGAANGPLLVVIHADYAEVATGYPVTLSARIEGRTTGSIWDLGDGTIVRNRPCLLPHAWLDPGDYVVRLTAYNDDYPAGVAALFTVRVVEAVHYVNQANLAPLFPFTSWDTAATTIQEAIAASQIPGRLVLVSDGSYDAGSTAVAGSFLTARIVLTNPVVVRSVNGPLVTIIQGAADALTTNGPGAVRCAYVGANAVLSGFTLTNGHTLATTGGYQACNLCGGGVWCNSGVVTNCILVGNRAAYGGGGAYQGGMLVCTFLDNEAPWAGGGAYECNLQGCVLARNRAWEGGGAYQGTLFDCLLTNNAATGYGGGARAAALTRCTLTGNSAGADGGGAYGSTLRSCLLNLNAADRGGGAYSSTFINCVVISNTVPHDGGGADSSVLYNTLVQGNWAGDDGGGVDDSTLYNCTVTGNRAAHGGGGSDESHFFNCIVYYNQASYNLNYNISSLDHSCSTPWYGGNGNITNEPAFVDAASGDYRLRKDSPCIDAGGAYLTVATNDLAGGPRLLDGNGDGLPVLDMGAYEFDLRTVVPTDWLVQYGLDPADPFVLSADPDHDGATTYQEWVADTDPTNAVSCFRVEIAATEPVLEVQFHSSSNRFYTLLACTNMAQAAWSVVPGQTNVPGVGGPQRLQDANGTAPHFYRVKIRAP